MFSTIAGWNRHFKHCVSLSLAMTYATREMMVLRLYYTTAFMSVSVGLTSVRVQITALLPELTRDYNERCWSLRLEKLAGES